VGLATVVVAYGCCVGSWDKLLRNVVPRVGDRTLITLAGQTSIAVAYNSILEAVRDRRPDMLVLLHDDLELTDPAAEEKLLAAVSEPDVALAGVAGGDLRSLYWWNGNRLGYQLTDSGPLDLGPRHGDTLIIEGSVMALSPWAITHLRFDTRYPGFLGYDDICVEARVRGKRVVVTDVDTHHHSVVGWKSDAIRDNFALCEQLFQEKWRRCETNDV